MSRPFLFRLPCAARRARRLPGVLGVVVLLSTTADLGAQEPRYFEAPAFHPHFTFQWDALARYDSIDHLKRRPPLSNDIDRGRFEARPELGFEFSDRFRIAVRAVGELGTDRNVENAPNFDNYRSRGAAIERYYLEAKPGDFIIRAGAFGMPLVASEMLWDRDIQTPGAAVSWQRSAGASGTLILSAAGFYGPQREADHTRIGVGQVVWRTGDESRLALEAALSYWHIDPDALKSHYGRQNYFFTQGDRAQLLSRYRIADAVVRLRFPAAGVPVLVSLDGLKNFGVEGPAQGEGDAFEGNVTLGSAGTPGNFRFFYTFQYVERDAVLGAYNTDDWWFHSWYRGHRVGVAYTFLPDVFLQTTVMFQKRLDLKNTLNRVLVELVKLF